MVQSPEWDIVVVGGAYTALTTTKLGARLALPYRQQVEDLLSRIKEKKIDSKP